LSQELYDYLRQRARMKPVSLGVCLALSLAFHAALVAVVLISPKSADKAVETKVTWVNLPAAPSGPAGGSGPQEEGKQGERVRRVEEVAPKPVAAPPVKAPPAPPTPNAFGTRHTAPVKGTSANPDSMGKAPVASKGKVTEANPAIGASGQGGGGGVGVGSPTAGVPGLNAVSGISGGTGQITDLDGSFPFLYYLKQAQSQITSNWARVGSGPGRVQVYFKIMRDGSLTGVRVESPSGIDAMDQSALMAVKRSTPLPRLPDGFEGSSLGVHFWFTYLGH
jgi:TonB family protein